MAYQVYGAVFTDGRCPVLLLLASSNFVILVELSNRPLHVEQRGRKTFVRPIKCHTKKVAGIADWAALVPGTGNQWQAIAFAMVIEVLSDFIVQSEFHV